MIGEIAGATGSFYYALRHVGAAALLGALSYVVPFGDVERIVIDQVVRIVRDVRVVRNVQGTRIVRRHIHENINSTCSQYVAPLCQFRGVWW
jgi:hypothetical protein